MSKRSTFGAQFRGGPFPAALALKRWPHRYSTPKKGSENKTSDSKKNQEEHSITECQAHYSKAEVDGHTYKLNDYVTVNADGGQDYTGRILELFETTDKARWLEIQWLFRPEDTVLGQEEAKKQDKKRLFYSDETDVIPLECITSKIKVFEVQPQLHSARKRKPAARGDYYYDMGYAYDYSTFYTIKTSGKTQAAIASNSASAVSNPTSIQRLIRFKRQPSPVDSVSVECKQAVVNRRSTRKSKFEPTKVSDRPRYERSSSDSCIVDSASELTQSKVPDSMVNGSSRKELSVLDMYSGCGGMSTGLRMGASLSNVNIETRWAVDINEYSCESFKSNHTNTEVRNEAAEDFLSLIKEWQKLCQKYSSDQLPTSSAKSETEVTQERIEENDMYLTKKKRQRTCGSASNNDSRCLGNGEYEVEKIIGVRWLDPTKRRKSGLEFKVHWKGYPEDEDSWEPLDSLTGCEERIKDFVVAGKARKILPLPGEVDIVCGGPPCQGISGLNRFRNMAAPLEDPKNQQIVVFMDTVQFLEPRFVFLENVVDILQFSGGLLARYALSRLVHMHYQAKISLLVAGCYGLPQFRMRFFLLGASPSETLPALPLPTHYVPLKGCTPSEWERNIVAYPENCTPQLNEAILLKDAISDLPPVTNAEKREQLRIIKQPSTDFQKFMRLPKENSVHKAPEFVEDHRPLVLNRDDFERIRRIPKKKGANFRDLPGVRKLADGTVQVDAEKAIKLSSGKQLVPNYALNYMQGKSSRPFGRIWWDEILSTLHTTPSPHHQKIIHPTQDRVLTIRECARLQGFPDYYKFCGPIKERYRQLGNAVAVPVAKALGYTLALAVQGEGGAKKEIKLRRDFFLAQQRKRKREPAEREREQQSTNQESTKPPNRTLRPRKALMTAASKI